MTWPTQPVSTQHLDQGSDNPRLARSDILTMANSVNAIQSTFAIVDPAAGDLLSYNTELGQFENRTQIETLGHQVRAAEISWQLASGILLPSISSDPNNMVTIDGGYWTLTAGTYLFLNSGYFSFNTFATAINITWNSETAGAIKNMQSTATGFIGQAIHLTPNYNLVRTIAVSETFRWTYSQSPASIPNLLILRLI